jgi:hypothetical protein
MAKTDSMHGRRFGLKQSLFGANLKGHDVKAFGDTTGKYFFWDASADTFYIVGNLNVNGTLSLDDIAMADAETLTFGTGSDVVIQWDGTNLIIAAAADDSLIEVGDSAATQKSFDLKWYANENSGASYLYADASANLIYTTGVDLQFKDNDYIVIGTGAGATGDVNIVWDGTNLIINAVADDTLIEIGDSAATQKSFDIKLYGNENSGASYLYFDASANLLYTTDIDVQFKDNDVLVFGTGAGATGDIQFKWDATNFVMSGTAANSSFNIGAAGNYINTTIHGTFTVGVNDSGYDVTFYGETSGKYMQFDQSEDNLLLYCGTQIIDNEILAIGTGANKTGDVQVKWDATNLLITATADDTLIEIGDSAATQLSFDLKWYGDDANGASYLYADASRNMIFTNKIELNTRRRFEVFDDFIMQTLVETDTPWILNNTAASDPAIYNTERGVLRFSTTDENGLVQAVCAIPVQADSGNLVFETRLRVDDITKIHIIAGLTDSTSIEKACSIAAGDAITTTLTDGCVFVYDTGADTDSWFAVGVSNNTDATGNGVTDTAPTNLVYQRLRIEVASDGATAKFYINDVLKKTLTANATRPSVDLYATVLVIGNTAGTTRNVDVDYIYVGHDR